MQNVQNEVPEINNKQFYASNNKNISSYYIPLRLCTAIDNKAKLKFLFRN